jgi:hypothetical protein
MTARKLYVTAFLLWLVVSQLSFGQVKKKIRSYERKFQLSLFPGISTNGIASASYFNNFSLNLFGGLSAGNRILELGIVSNVNIQDATGIQIAGLANIIGVNAFLNLTLSEERALIQEEYTSDIKGIQLAGLLNYVRNNSSGIQISGGLNAIDGDFSGFQLAGIGNSSGGTSRGFMLAGLYNMSDESVGGFQISSIFNYTNEELSGVQLATVNKAIRMKGKKSTPSVKQRGLQIGLLNFSEEMDGVQIGLINFGGAMRGKQIALINFFSKHPSKEYIRMGTPIGLLNFGSKGSVLRFYYNELFTANIEYTTGNCLNCSWVQGSEMPYHDSNKIYNQNALLVGYNAFNETWGFGYGFQKILYNKAFVRPNPNNEKRVIVYGLKFIHLNRTLSFDNTFNLVSKLHIEYGKRKYGMHFYCGMSLNYFLYEDQVDSDEYHIASIIVSAGKLLGVQSIFWPGYSVGVQF